jgi:uncharacterized protein YidB (DUF937 family)
MIMALLGVLAYRTFKGQGRLAELLGKSDNAAGTSSGGGTLGGLLPGAALSSGLSNLLDRFRQNGHGDKAESWIQNQPNAPIAPTEMGEALGPERVQWLMQQTGMSKDELLVGLSSHLPQAVNQLTPDGRIPTAPEAERLV